MSRSFTLDLALDVEEIPEPGDIVLGVRVAYRVTSIRPVESRIWPNRWKLGVQPLGDYDRLRPPLPEGDGRHWHARPYRRGERPQDCFGPAS